MEEITEIINPERVAFLLEEMFAGYIHSGRCNSDIMPEMYDLKVMIVELAKNGNL